MTGSLFLALAGAMICTALVLILRQLLLAPVKLGKNTEQMIILKVYGSEPKLEDALNSLIWLCQNSILNAELIIIGFELDEETAFVAKCFEQEHRNITLIQDGEISQWIRNLS